VGWEAVPVLPFQLATHEHRTMLAKAVPPPPVPHPTHHSHRPTWAISAWKSLLRSLTFMRTMATVNRPPLTPVKTAHPNATASRCMVVERNMWGFGSIEA
jgi:hypothetical protein